MSAPIQENALTLRTMKLDTRILRWLWVLPLTLPALGIVLLAAATGGRWRAERGALIAIGGWPARWLAPGRHCRDRILALTCGHVILAPDEASLERAIWHELAHVRQFERWGPLFPFAYVAAGLAARWQGGSYYADNRFEIEACAAERDAGGSIRTSCPRRTS